MKLKLSEIARLLDGEVDKHPEKEVHEIHSLANAGISSISFLANPRYEQQLYHSKAAAVIVDRAFKPKSTIEPALIKVDDPYLGFTTLLEEYHRLHSLLESGVESNTHIGANTKYGEDFYLGSFSYVGRNVKIGNSVKIFPQVYIGHQVEIGDHTILYPGAKIYSNTKIGRYCTIQAGAVIGSHGFGFAPQADGSYKNIPQIGNVILKDHVDIGANTTIDCGTLESTIVEKGVKIDNLVQVAHNVEIGENTVIAAQTGISGSTRIGRNVRFGGQAGVGGHIYISDQTQVTAKSGVTKSINKPGQTIGGKFGFDNTEYLKSYALFKKLPNVMKRIEELEENYLETGSRK